MRFFLIEFDFNSGSRMRIGFIADNPVGVSDCMAGTTFYGIIWNTNR